MKGVEQIAPLYDGIVGLFNGLGLGSRRRELVGRLAGDVLEIGVGTGLNLHYYGPDARVTAIDPDRNLLRAAGPRASRRGYTLEVADAQALPFRDGSFDAVVSTLVFCSIPEPARALGEIRRVLRVGGRLHQLEHTRANRRRVDAALSLIEPAWFRLSGGCHIARDTARLLRETGWLIERHERYGGGLMRLLISAPG